MDDAKHIHTYRLVFKQHNETARFVHVQAMNIHSLNFLYRQRRKFDSSTQWNAEISCKV